METENRYQDSKCFTASIKAVESNPKMYRAEFSDNGFAVYADDKLIWKKTVYKAIIPKQCKFIAGKRLEVKLKKLISEELWTDPPWRDDKRSSDSMTAIKHIVPVTNPCYKKSSSEAAPSHGSHNRETTNPNARKNDVNQPEIQGHGRVKELTKVYSDSGVATKGDSTDSNPSTKPSHGSSSTYTLNPSNVAPHDDPLKMDVHDMSSHFVVIEPSLVFNPLETRAHQYVFIEFHCLLSAVQWGFDSSSKVYMRFGASQLGKFKHCYGPMKRINSSEDGFLEFSYTMKVPFEVLRDHNAAQRKYKYHVDSPLSRRVAISSLEFITGTVKHYDGVIWPEVKDKSVCVDTNVGLGTRAKNAFFGWFSRSQTTTSSSEQGLIDVKSLSQSHHVELRKKALSIYLNGLQDVLYGPESIVDPIDTIRTVHSMYLSLHNSYVTYAYHGQHEVDWRLKETPDAMYEFLMSMAGSLVETIYAHPSSCFLAKILVLLMIFYKCEMLTRFSSSKAYFHTQCSLLRNLAIQDESSCQVLSADFVIHYAKSIGELVEMLIGNAIKSNPPITEWIFAVPLLHFVMKNCKPYEQLERISWDYNDFKKFQWGDFHGVLQTVSQNLSDVHFRELQPLFHIDPYFLRYFVFKTDINNLSSLFGKVPISILVMRLTRDCMHMIKPQIKDIVPTLLVPVSTPSDSVLNEEDVDIIKASLCFLNIVLKVPKERDEDFFVNVIKLVLYAFSRKSFSQEIKNKVIRNLENFLYQISHRIFQNKEFSALNKKPMQLEIQYWNRMVQLECLEHVAVLWKKVVRNIITVRLPEFTKPTQIASILIEMDVAKTPAILTDCVFDHILKTTERTPQQSFELNNLIKELLKLTHMSNRLLSIINTCLLKIYPNFAQSRLITIDELQQWDLWPKILTVFVQGCSVVLADIKNISEIVHSALFVIIQLCKNIVNAKISMYDLEKCGRNVEQLQALCNAANSGITPLCPDSNHVKKAMKICSKKFGYVEKFSKMIEVVVKHCNKISKDVTKNLSEELRCDFRSKEINSLCIDDGNGTFKCVHFSIHKLPPQDMIEYFVVFDESKVFESIWDDCCDKLDKASITTFNDIHEHVWKHTVKACKDLLYKLYNKSFTYADINIKCFTDARNINIHVTALYNAMHQCYNSLVSSLPDPKQWIPQAVKNITVYLNFAKYSMQANSDTAQINAIQLCLKMKDLLRLTGDFSVVHNLNIQISASSAQSSFAEVGIDKVEQWLELRNVYGDPAFQKFYGVLCDNMMLIEWLRKETRDCDHLECFVEVNKSATKIYAETTLLSNLHEIGREFAALIYNLPENTGYKEFHIKCKLILDALNRHSYLTNTMEKCCKNLDWFKTLKSKMGRFDFSKTEPLLYSPPEVTNTECVVIKFYCLVSIERWGFDESSEVYLRFAAPELGTFYTCHGPMTLTQRDNEDYHEFCYPVKIPVRLLKNHDPVVHKYKYHVESPATKNGLIKSLEFIVGPTTSGGVIDRFLTVYYNENQLQNGSIYQRFDGIIMPEHKINIPKVPSSSSWLPFSSGKDDPSLCNGVKLSSFDYHTQDLKTANHKELRKSSLLMHLQNVHGILVGDQSMDDPLFCIEVVCAIYLSLHKYYLCYKKAQAYGYLRDHDWEFRETTKEMETWLILTTHSLANNIRNQPRKSYLDNILCLLVIYFKTDMLRDFCRKSEHANLISILLKNLAIDSSSVLETKVNSFHTNHGQLFLQSFLSFINGIINFHPSLTEWIFAIPIIHLLMGKHNRLSIVEWNEDPTKFKFQWGDDWESVDKKKLQWKPHDHLDNYIQELQPLFEIDPLLLRLFVKVTALEDLQLLISKVPTSILLMRLAEECTYGYQEIIVKIVGFILNALVHSEWITLQSEEDILAVKTSLYLFKKISLRIPKKRDYENLIKPVIRLVLIATSRVYSNRSISGNELVEVKEKVTISLNDTVAVVTTAKLIFSIFNVQHKIQGKAEVQYWNEMFELQCPDNVKQLWHDVCKAVMIKRLPRISKPSETMSVFQNIDFSEAHDMVVCCILNYLIEAMQQSEQKDLDDTGLLKGFQGLVEKPSVAENVVSLLNKVLDNKYSTSKGIQVQELLTWNFWPDIIKIFVKACTTLTRKESLEVDDMKDISETVHAALLQLNNLSDDIKNGIVTGKEVEGYRKQAKLQVLYEAANIGKSPLVPQFTEVSIAIQVCVKKLEILEEYRSKLSVVMEYCKCISKDLFQVMHQKISDNDDDKLYNKRICDICKVEDSGCYKCVCFFIPELDNEMIDNFIVCGKHANGTTNEVFKYCWDQQIELSAIKTVKDISFVSVFIKVWKPTISQCQLLLHNLKCKAVTLQEAEKLYQIDNLSSHLCALCNAMHHCYPEPKESLIPPDEWVSQTVSHIALYLEIANNQKCTDAAELILKVQTKLKLEGDFRIVEDLAKHMDADFKEQPLSDISEQLIGKWIGITSMYSSGMLYKCLDVFSNNTSLVFWLKEATNGVSQLASFVEVCNSTAGEEEFNMKRLSYLHSVGSNFASLIYELPDDANFDKFDEKCKTVINLLENNPKLAESLEECNKHLDWFKELKATQGSFEVTAISKVNDINQWGEYKVSSTEEMPLLFIGNAIKLKIHRLNAVKQEYSLDDLRDLESKLVLITGKHAAGKVEIDKFLNYLHLVCRIANALLALRNAGHARYITWSYSFHCEFDVYDVLENQAIKMENELKEWKDEIAKSRNTFHVLNLFTTQQLRVIRQQLGQLNCERIPFLPPKVISMLMSLSPKICERDIKECLQLVKSKSSVVGQSSSKKSEDLESLSGPVDHDDNVPLSQFNPENEVSMKAAIEKLVMQLIDRLSDVEKKAYEALKGIYRDEVAYLSIKNCSDASMQQEGLIEKASAWCLENGNAYENEDPQVVFDEIQGLNSQNNVSTQNEQNAQNSAQIENNSSPVVETQDDNVYLMEQMLIENEIPSGLAREAAELYPDDIEEALGYCLIEQNRSTEDSFLLSTHGSRKNPYVEHYDVIKVNEYMDLVSLAKVLDELMKRFAGQLIKARKFIDSFFNLGEPNLILVPSGKVLKTALSLYCEHDQPFPSMDEVVICTSETTTEDIVLLWRRAIWDPGYKQVFCLLFAEKLSYKVCDESLAELDKFSQGKNDYRIVIICSSESEETSHVVSKLLQFRRDYAILQKDEELAEYLKRHFKAGDLQSAANIDPEKSSVRVVSSEKPGMGKSLHVKKLAEKLKNKDSYCIVPVHGPVVDFNTVMKLLQPFTPSYESLPPQIIHMDIDSEVLSVIDTVLFSLLILKSLKDKNGNVWRLVSSQLYMIEVTYCENESKAQQESTLSLLQLLPSIKCAGPEVSLKLNQSEDFTIDKHEFKNKVFQCVFQYLRRFDARIDLSSFIYKEPSVEGDYSSCISTIKNRCNMLHPSWAELAQFVRFLYVQLNDCQSSIYCNQEFFGKDTDFKTFVVEFMIRMSQDFAMRSLRIIEDGNAGKDAVHKYEIKEGRKWDESHHPYIFFNQDHMTMTFVGFNVDDNGQCYDFKSKGIIKGCQVPVKVCKCLATQGVNLQKEDCNKWTKQDMIDRLCRVFGVDYAEDPDESYVLTSDNFLKMMAIHMRFRCDIPVVIMGETGCGKTRLIRYMCDLQTCDTGVNNLLMLKVHGGTSEEDISKAVVNTEELAIHNYKKNPKLYTILFFDEANTTENIGLIKEIMCDRRLKGRQINDNVKFIAACNPYRKHTDEMITKLETAGLGYYVKSDNTQHKFGNIPLRHLVYRVLDLPLSMQPLLYDFGQVTGKTEDEYIHQIVANHVYKNKQISCYSNVSGLIDAMTELLAASQSFMRTKQDECSFVSLRDVERAMIVFEWFYENNEFFERLLKDEEGYEYTNRETRSIILTLAVCYHARIQERENFELEICSKFKPPISEKPISKEKFVKEISSFQGMILSQMDSNIPKNIARNVALKENVFMMLVCIELKIPLFVIGKPGSSKSLAKSIIENSMQGPSSSNELCKKLKQVKLFSYQCSQHSTPATIVEVFNNAKKFQESKDMKQLISLERKNTKQFVSVVVLDEVGLAEDSPSLPLKALHPLLEDGTSGADAKVQHIAREDRVAFVGISNWALDPAKMNRGVMITRGSPDEKELEQSARGICSNEKNDPVRDKLDMFFSPLSKAYMEICKTQTREFFGLRDFYSLIKMLYWMVSKTDSPPTEPSLTENQLIHAIRRNFDGLDKFDAAKIFLSYIDSKHLGTQTESSKDRKTLYPDCEIIKASLDTKDISWHGESRYLLFMTENFAALRVLQQHLLCDEKEPPFVLFGSSFPKDMEYTQVCRNINQIKICMETGRTVILLNLENLYESLYDVLNQYYTKLRENRYVDLGLQSHRIKCRVDDKFKMILIAEKETVYKEFPTPLINRLEKHFVDTSTILTKPQKEIMDRLKKWAQDFTTIAKLDNLAKLKLGDAFVGYQEDTPAAVVFQAYHHLKATKQWEAEDAMSEEQKDLIFKKGKNLLLDIASPDAIVRLRYSKLADEFDAVFNMYFIEQSHSSLFELLSSKLPKSLDRPSNEGTGESVALSLPAQKEMLLLQITTHSHLLSEPDVTQLCDALKLKRKNIAHFLLQEFDTEMDFCNKLKLVMEQDVIGHKILIIQCDCGHLHSNLIACARHKVIDEIVVPQSSSKGSESEETTQAKNESNTSNSSKLQCKSTVHVIFIIQLPRKAGGTNFVGFQGGDWLSVHLDDLRPLKENELSFQSAIQCSISEIFNTMYQSITCPALELEPPSLEQEVESSTSEEEPEHSQTQSLSLDASQGLHVPSNKFQSVAFNANRRLRDLIQMACSLLYDTELNRERRERTTKRISILTDLIPTESTKDKSRFDCRLIQFVTAVLKEMDDKNFKAKEWAFEEALKHSQISGTFRNALSRRLDQILLPILAKIIALIDKNFNLTIIHEHRDNVRILSPIAKLWLEIFSERKLCKISYEDVFANASITKTKKWVPRIGASLSDQFYKCQFPFSWICREVMNVQKRDSAVLAERYNVKHIKKMSELLEPSPLGAILNLCVPNDDEAVHKKLCCFYLNDYIFSTYKPSMIDEQELVYDAVYSRFSQLSANLPTFLEKLVALHLAYAELEPQLQQFQHLVSLSPKIVSSVFKKLNEDNDLKNEISDLALCTVKVLLIDLKHGKEWNIDQTKQWIQKVSYYQNSINSILNLKTLKFGNTTNARKDWMRILALKTFAITIGLHYNNNNTLKALKQLTTFLINPNFKSVNILKNVKLVLRNLQTSMKKSWNLKDDDDTNEAKQNEINDYFKFISCCEKYFIELITNFCFEQTYDSKDPDPAMIDFLIECIFTKESSSTKSLTPFSDRGDDTVPVVRSYLLQLLIGLKAEYTWSKLESYFDISRRLAEENDTDLHVLCIQCFEDKHYKNNERTIGPEDCLELLKTHMDEYQIVPVFTVRYFNSIATIRFCLSQFSDILNDWYDGDGKPFPEEWLQVLKTVEQLFNSPKGNYPAEYFIKYIVRQHCIQLFNHLKACEKPSFDWIIPDHLKSKEENDEFVTNPAVVYCGANESFFNKFSDSLTLAISSKDTTELEEVIKDISDPTYPVMMVMAVYANVALKQTPLSQDMNISKSSIVTVAHHANFSLYPSALPQVVTDCLTKFVTNSAIFSSGLKEIAKDMLCGICRASPDVIKMQGLQSKQIHGIIIHCVTVFHQRERVQFLKPCVELLKNLSSMKNMYLPTMPEVCEFQSDLQLMGTYYICENKHKFLVIVDDCEDVDSVVECSCQKEAKRLDEKYKSKDEKATGHILGSAASRSKDQVQERNLSAPNCSILRIFLHAILTWNSSFIDKDNPPNLDDCISPDIPVQSLERFFMRNLEKDLITLSSSLGRSVDDAVLTVHLVLKQLSQISDQDFPGYTGKWSSGDERQEWEKQFSAILIDPVIADMETVLRNTYSLAMKDTDTLYSRIYESTEESDSYSALWRFRTRLSLKDLMRSAQTKSHKILNKFLEQEPTLRAMQYLPGILKLQKYLFDHFHHQIGQEKAMSETIGVYLKSLQKDKEMFAELVQGFNEAWLLLKNQLKSHGRLRVPLEYIDDVPEITNDTKLAYLMPTTTGEGICSSSMVDFLVYQHNEFIQFCYKNLPRTYYDPNICQKLLENAVPLSQLQASHVLNYEHKLIPVILTHCQYSLRYGKGTEVAYDFEAIERDLIDKFIFGKPLILMDEMPRVMLRKDAHDATFYESIMASVHQENLQLEKKNTLIAEITKLNLHKLSDLLDVVEIVLGFLASAGGKPDQTFNNYITKTLTMQKTHIPKAVRDCTLTTTISLWRIVSVVHSCRLTALGKDPFDRLDKAYCEPLGTTKEDKKTKPDDSSVNAKPDDSNAVKDRRLNELQQTFKRIESPIDFLIAFHNFIAVFVSHRSPTEDCNPNWRFTKTWKEAMESSCFYHKADLESIIIKDDIRMYHTAAVWKEAVGLLWPKVYQQ